MSDKRDEKRVIKSIDELLAFFNELEFFTNHFFEGVRLAKEGDLFEAEMMFRKTLEGHEDSGSWSNLAKTLELQSREAYAKAEMHIREFLEDMRELYDGELPDEHFTEGPPEQIDVLFTLARAQFGQFKLDEAQLTFLWILRLSPEEVRAWKGLGHCLQITGRFEDAGRAYRVVQTLEQNQTGHGDSRAGRVNIPRLVAKMTQLSDFAPQQILGPIELMLRWVGEAPDFILKIIKGLAAIHGKFLRKKTVIQQAKIQGMPEKLAKQTIENLLNEGIIYTPKKGKISRVF